METQTRLSRHVCLFLYIYIYIYIYIYVDIHIIRMMLHLQ